MSLDQDAINQQLALLAAHRRTLGVLLWQQTLFGGVAYTPPVTINAIEEARAEIQRIKATLCESDVVMEDEPNDEKSPQPEPVVPQQTRDGDQITVGAIVGSTAVAIGAGAQANATIIQLPKLEAALHQLRAPVGDFVGRSDEIDRLVSALRKGGTAATISGVRGMGGIGKTELAYAAAQQLKDAFPDAQLLIELRGASTNPLTPEAALQAVIRSFEREAKLPDDLSQLKAIYSSVLSGKKALIFADDAKDTAQVRPLLPPAGCALLITSRNKFSLPGMAGLDLGTLPKVDAEQLLLEVCPRIGEHASTLAKLCGHLPLALRVSASFLASSDTYSVARYAGQLVGARLKYLRDPDDPDDPQASVEASLRLSYDALEVPAQAVLCQLSVFPTSFDITAALALVEIEGEVAEVLDLLRRRSLLEWDAALERFSLHELVRVFAAARLEDADAVRLRHAWLYAQVAKAAETFYLEGGAATLIGLALFDNARLHIDAGWGWARARAGEQDADALLLAYVTANVGDLRYDKRRERIPQLEAALAATRRLGHKDAEGVFLGNLGNAYADLGDARQAITFLKQSLEIARELDDRRGQGMALGNLGLVYLDLGDARQAITFFEQSLVICRELGDRSGEGAALGNLGSACLDLEDADLEDARQAITFHKQSLEIARELDDRRGEESALGNLGNAYYALGDARQAITFYEQCVEIARELGDRRGEAGTSWNLGLVLEEQGHLAQAVAAMQVYVDFLSEIGHPDAEKHIAELAELRHRLAGGGSGLRGLWRRLMSRK